MTYLEVIGYASFCIACFLAGGMTFTMIANHQFRAELDEMQNDLIDIRDNLTEGGENE